MSLGEFLGSGTGTTKALYHLNGSSVDSSGNGNNGTDTAITYVDGKFGKCASFDNATDKIEVADSASVSITGAMTVSGWAKITSIANTKYLSFAFKDDNSTNRSYQFILYNGAGTYTFYLYVSPAGNGTGSATGVYNWTLETNNWHNFVFTYIPSTSLNLYIDGVLVYTYTTSIPASIYDGTAPLNIGSNGLGFVGLYDEAIIENRAWSASEIKKYYTYAKGRFGL